MKEEDNITYESKRKKLRIKTGSKLEEERQLIPFYIFFKKEERKRMWQKSQT